LHARFSSSKSRRLLKTQASRFLVHHGTSKAFQAPRGATRNQALAFVSNN
jgi:hypothetical protein